MRILVGLLLIAMFGCCTPKGPDKDWTGTARILPIIVTTSNGQTRWTNDQLTNAFKHTNTYWSDIRVQFKVAEPEIMVSDKFYHQNGISDFLSLMSASRKIAKERHIYPVYFVESIKWGDNVYAGMSTSADAPLGFQYGTVVSAIVRNNSSQVIAHELGHVWSLRHTWQDKHSDTPSTGSSDCNDLIHCNIMSYCSARLNCPPPPFFSVEQIEEVRAWALSGSRFHLLETDTIVQQILLPLLTEFKPFLDPVDAFDGV